MNQDPTEGRLTEEEKTTLAENEQKAKVLSEQKIKSLLEFLDLDSCSPDTKFFDVDYAGKYGTGRTVMCLGQFAIHIRATGHRKGMFWDESKGMNLQDDRAFDTSVSTLRHHIGTITVDRRKREPDELEQLIEGEQATNKDIANLTIHFSQGSFEMRALELDMARSLKKLIYDWITNY